MDAAILGEQFRWNFNDAELLVFIFKLYLSSARNDSKINEYLMFITDYGIDKKIFYSLYSILNHIYPK